MTWPEFYRKRVGNAESFKSFRAKYLEFFLTIASYQPDTIAEYGCGIATCSKILLGWKPKLHASLVDNDPSLFDMAFANIDIADMARVERIPFLPTFLDDVA